MPASGPDPVDPAVPGRSLGPLGVLLSGFSLQCGQGRRRRRGCPWPALLGHRQPQDEFGRVPHPGCGQRGERGLAGLSRERGWAGAGAEAHWPDLLLPFLPPLPGVSFSFLHKSLLAESQEQTDDALSFHLLPPPSSRPVVILHRHGPSPRRGARSACTFTTSPTTTFFVRSFLHLQVRRPGKGEQGLLPQVVQFRWQSKNLNPGLFALAACALPTPPSVFLFSRFSGLGYFRAARELV